MLYRSIASAALAISMFAGYSALAAKETTESTHDGKFVSVNGDQLEMTTSKGMKHSHMLASDAKVTRDGKACKASDLKSGMRIRVTTKTDDKNIATHIEAIDKNELFANMHDGKFVRLKDHKLEMTDSKGKEHSHTVSKDATMTVDGKDCKAEHLKSGMKIRVTTEKDDSSVATHIEAIDKDAQFSRNI